MNNLIKETAKNAGINSAEVTDKACELFRKLDMKFPKGSLRNVEINKHIIAIELACRILEAPYLKEKLIKESIVNQTDYNKSFNFCKAALEISFSDTNLLKKVYVDNGLEIKEETHKIIEDYNNIFLVTKNSTPIKDKCLLECIALHIVLKNHNKVNKLKFLILTVRFAVYSKKII
jgi:transcription initiation factor TFIIIB Brf1 subunit/transcription initiation factor TFIIB